MFLEISEKLISFLINWGLCLVFGYGWGGSFGVGVDLAGVGVRGWGWSILGWGLVVVGEGQFNSPLALQGGKS